VYLPLYHAWSTTISNTSANVAIIKRIASNLSCDHTLGTHDQPILNSDCIAQVPRKARAAHFGQRGLKTARAAGRERERRSTEPTYSLIVRTTLEVGRPSTVGSLASLRICSSYDAMVVNVPFGFMNTIR
jgi:hypothetical protein